MRAVVYVGKTGGRAEELYIFIFYIGTDRKIYILPYISRIVMDIQNIKRKRFPRSQKKSIALSIRITPALSEWLKKNDFSPTGVFYEAVKDLGFKE